MEFDTNFRFPTDSTFSKNELEQQFFKCLYNSAEQEMLHYWVILPKNLKAAELSPVSFPDTRLTNIGRYLTADDSTYLEVWAAYEHCSWEMNPSDWLLNRLALMGEKIINQRIIFKPDSGNLLDVLTIKTHTSGEDVVSRFTVHKDYNPKSGGGNYFLMKASCALRDYESLANEMLVIVTNWNLAHRSNLVTAEQLITVNLNKTSSFQIPASWQTKIIAQNRLVVEHTIDDNNYGVINVYFYPLERFQTPNDVYAASVARFHKPGGDVKLTSDEINIIPNEINEKSGYVFYVCTGEVSSEKDNMHGYYQMIIFKQAGLWCYAEQIGMYRNFDDYHYETNKRCLELIVATINLDSGHKS